MRYNQKEFWHLEKVKDVVKGVCAGMPVAVLHAYTVNFHPGEDRRLSSFVVASR